MTSIELGVIFRKTSLYIPSLLRDSLANEPGTLGQDTCKKLQGSNYFCIFYLFDLKLGVMVELCIPKKPMFFVFRF